MTTKLEQPWKDILGIGEVERVLLADVRDGRHVIVAEVAEDFWASGAGSVHGETIPEGATPPPSGVISETCYGVIGVRLADAVLHLDVEDALPTGLYEMPEVRCKLDAYLGRHRRKLACDRRYQEEYALVTERSAGFDRAMAS